MADLVFVDKTNLRVGPTSEVRLDKFVTIRAALRAVWLCKRPAAPSDLLPAHKRTRSTKSALRMGRLAYAARPWNSWLTNLGKIA